MRKKEVKCVREIRELLRLAWDSSVRFNSDIQIRYCNVEIRIIIMLVLNWHFSTAAAANIALKLIGDHKNALQWIGNVNFKVARIYWKVNQAFCKEKVKRNQV